MKKLFVVALACVGMTGCVLSSYSVIRIAESIPFTESGYKPNLGNNLTRPLQRLEARLAELQITVAVMPEEEHADGNGNWGKTAAAMRIIWMPSDLTVNTRFEVLAHEAAHLYQPTNISHGRGAELFAELVAWRVARHYGHNMTKSSGRYLAGYKEALGFERAYRIDIHRAFKILVGKGDVWD